MLSLPKPQNLVQYTVTMGEDFTTALNPQLKNFLNYAKLHPDFFSLHETEFETSYLLPILWGMAYQMIWDI